MIEEYFYCSIYFDVDLKPFKTNLILEPVQILQYWGINNFDFFL
jgi:hypothetical protein